MNNKEVPLLPKTIPVAKPAASSAEQSFEEEVPVAEHALDADDLYEPNAEDEGNLNQFPTTFPGPLNEVFFQSESGS